MKIQILLNILGLITLFITLYFSLPQFLKIFTRKHVPYIKGVLSEIYKRKIEFKIPMHYLILSLIILFLVFTDNIITPYLPEPEQLRIKEIIYEGRDYNAVIVPPNNRATELNCFIPDFINITKVSPPPRIIDRINKKEYIWDNPIPIQLNGKFNTNFSFPYIIQSELDPKIIKKGESIKLIVDIITKEDVEDTFFNIEFNFACQGCEIETENDLTQSFDPWSIIMKDEKYFKKNQRYTYKFDIAPNYEFTPYIELRYSQKGFIICNMKGVKSIIESNIVDWQRFDELKIDDFNNK